MSDAEKDTTFECRDCGREYEWEGEEILCWCGKQKTRVAYPCGICDKPIIMAEICRECGEESDLNAFSTPWGSGWS